MRAVVKRLLLKLAVFMDLAVVEVPDPELLELTDAPQRFRCSVAGCHFEGVWFPRNLRGAITPVCSHDYNLGIAEGTWSELDDRDNWNTKKAQ